MWGHRESDVIEWLSHSLSPAWRVECFLVAGLGKLGNFSRKSFHTRDIGKKSVLREKHTWSLLGVCQLFKVILATSLCYFLELNRRQWRGKAWGYLTSPLCSPSPFPQVLPLVSWCPTPPPAIVEESDWNKVCRETQQVITMLNKKSLLPMCSKLNPDSSHLWQGETQGSILFPSSPWSVDHVGTIKLIAFLTIKNFTVIAL